LLEKLLESKIGSMIKRTQNDKTKSEKFFSLFLIDEISVFELNEKMLFKRIQKTHILKSKRKNKKIRTVKY